MTISIPEGFLLKHGTPHSKTRRSPPAKVAELDDLLSIVDPRLLG